MVKNRQRKQRILKRDFKEPRANEWDQDRRKPKAEGDGYEEPVLSNEMFEEYYRQQKIVPEAEWDAFIACLRTPLPTAFRVNGTGKFAAELRDKLEHDFFAKLRQEPSEVDGEKLESPKPISWYPNKLAWQFTYSRGQLRKVQALHNIHELLKKENTGGGISRQEAVSMAPPLFLDIQHHHKILDTCAAPGSKTAQMLELLHAGAELPTGFVVANDLDPSRCNLLVHQTKRMNSPALVVTNHDASTFPLISHNSKEERLQFDRILCDVPCSGDGTLRKATDIWRKWNFASGPGMHPLQLRITLHTAGLLKIGGRMVYSTCSFNPVENEAVVAEVLRQSQGALKLLDMSEHLPTFPRSPGIQSWFLRGKSSTYHSSLEEAEQAHPLNNFSASMFPDPASGELQLQRCMRVLPHHGDTGGFFIAVLEKSSEMPALQPERWKRGREKAAELARKRRIQRANANGIQAAPEMEAAGNGLEEDTALAGAAEGPDADPPPRVALSDMKDASEGPPLPTGPSTAEVSGEHLENGVHDNQRPFGSAVEARADDAAQAAVTFADAVADEDMKEALGAAEDAAEAAEDVADEVMARQPADSQPRAASEASNSPLPEAPSPAEVPEEEGSGAKDAGNVPAALEAKKPPEGRPQGRRRRERPGEEPFEVFPESAALDAIVDFFGFKDSLPLKDQLVMRIGAGNVIGARKLYYISSGVKELLKKDVNKALKISSAGLKVLERNDKKDPCASLCPYRISQHGLGLLLPHITKQILRPTASETLRLLKERTVALPAAQRLRHQQGTDEAAEPTAKRQKAESGAEGVPQSIGAEEGNQEAVKEAPPRHTGERIEPQGEAHRIPLSDLETLEQLQRIQGGCTVCMLREEEAKDLGLQATAQASGVIGAEPIAFVGWRGRANLSILVDKSDAAQMAENLEAAIQRFAARHAPGPI